MTVSAMLMRRFSAIASVLEDDDLDTVADRLSLHGLGAVVVLSGAGRLAGIITDADLVKAISGRRRGLSSLRAREIMNPEVFTCRSDETELEILTIMSQKQIRHMAVMLDESVIGLVTLDEAVKQRLHKVRQLNELAVHEPDNEKRLALVDRHLKESWNIFEVFRAVCSVQDDMGLTLLSDRTKQLLWLVGDAEDTGNPLRLKDLMMGHKQGAYPTVRRHIAELVEAGLITRSLPIEGRGRQFLLSERGRNGFARMTRAVSDAIMAAAR